MRQVVYIANSDSQSIEVWNLHCNGNMNLIQKIETYAEVQPIEIMKEKNLLYAGVSSNNEIITYFIDDNGFLEKKSSISITGKANYISLNHTNEFLFCSSYHANCLNVNSLNQYGIPQNAIQIIHNIQGCHCARINDKYNILFVTSLKEDRIYLYYLTNFGILQSTEQQFLNVQKKSGPRHIVFHPNQDFIYTINELNGTIDVWNINKINNRIHIKHIQNINLLKDQFQKKHWSSDIKLTSCGRFLYASDRFFNIISLFHINQNNNKIVFYKNYKTEKQPRSFAIDFTNKYLIVAGEKSNKLIIYSINNETGELKLLNIHHTGKRPIWVVIHKL
ncbi:6-phosphogluconolactonase [Buchnera aphidicola]|uniref:6-phosphogluconolactonase n=1 Tax=Buchnera aphidicola (Artemisaphis artemisicola) TaxID=1241836 RepID=A0A4D6XM14_9GAMM|nr:6-phosphogluconolactonase [Buchnera aphidicola]QCI15968.1 6-phosphogluconolactonase [Buchnera aphidicola (Artemisaphis artemisicola)]